MHDACPMMIMLAAARAGLLAPLPHSSGVRLPCRFTWMMVSASIHRIHSARSRDVSASSLRSSPTLEYLQRGRC